MAFYFEIIIRKGFLAKLGKLALHRSKNWNALFSHNPIHCLNLTGDQMGLGKRRLEACLLMQVFTAQF